MFHRTHNSSGFTFLHPAFDFKPGKKQPDSGLGHFGSRYLSIVLEVGDSDSLAQLEIDAKFWLEGPPQVCPFLPTHQNIPKIIIKLWQAVGTDGHFCMVWENDWSLAASPLHILLSDIFGDEVPKVYGENDRMSVDTESWQHKILKGF